MPVTWGSRGSVFLLSVIDVVTNQEIERAFTEAVANAPSKYGLRLLWDASASALVKYFVSDLLTQPPRSDVGRSRSSGEARRR